MPNPSLVYRNRGIVSESELTETIQKADLITNDYFRLRVKALLALVKKFGKRRQEIATLEIKDLETKKAYLYITFTIVKKHKRGFHQYLKFLKKSGQPFGHKTHDQLVSEWQSWTETVEGKRFKSETRIKKVRLEDKYARLILEYLDYMKTHYPKTKHLFPSGHSVFGQAYIINETEHISGRQLLRLVKPLNPSLWLHLLRETKGAEIARQYGNSLSGVYAVKETLDLENMDTAYHYVSRYAIQEMKAET